jgi:predicted GNAT superfamily acetyltransferase
MADSRYYGQYGQMDAQGSVPTPMEMSQDKLDEKARKWQQLQAKVLTALCRIHIECKAPVIAA